MSKLELVNAMSVFKARNELSVSIDHNAAGEEFISITTKSIHDRRRGTSGPVVYLAEDQARFLAKAILDYVGTEEQVKDYGLSSFTTNKVIEEIRYIKRRQDIGTYYKDDWDDIMLLLSKVRHPSMPNYSRNLARFILDECRKRTVGVPIYLSHRLIALSQEEDDEA